VLHKEPNEEKLGTQ